MFLCVFGCVLLGGAIAVISLKARAMVDDSHKDHVSPPLRDVVHSMTELCYEDCDILHRREQLDAFLVGFCALTVVVAMFQSRCDVLWTYLQLLGFLYGMRIPLYSFTILPAIQTRLPNSVLVGSRDLVFSGHTMLMCVASFVMEKELGVTPISGFWFVITFAFACATVFVRKHYTVDVLVAIAITVPWLLVWSK